MNELSTPRRQLALSVALGFAIIMVDGFDLQSIGYLAPEMAGERAIPISAFGPVFAAGLAGTIPGAMLAGPVGRLIGRRAMLALALVVFGVGSLISSMVVDVAALAIVRFFVGLGLGAAIPLVMASVADAASSRWRSTLVVLTLCGQPLGAILGAAVTAQLLPDHGWRAGFILGGIIPLVLAPMVFLLPRFGARAEEGQMEGPIGRVADLFDHRLIATTFYVWATSFALLLAVYIIINWLPAIVRAEGRSLEMSILAVSLCNAGTIVGALIIGFLMDRFDPLAIMPGSLVLASGALIGLDLTRAAPDLFLGFSLLAGLLGGGASAAFGALIVSLYPMAMRATGAGWALAVGRIGAALGPIGIGAALAAGMMPARLFEIAATSTLLSALALFLLARSKRAAQGAK